MNDKFSRRRKMQRRLDRQLDALEHGVPAAAGFIHYLRGRRLAIIRIPLGLLLVIGGCLSILPVLGVWMLPLGLLLLAIDLPALRPLITLVAIRLRRRINTLSRRFR